jgi:hypothetical protein
MFYEPDNGQPVEIVINDISKDHIHGYVSAPKYHQSELAAMASNNNNSGNGQDSSQTGATQSSGDGGIVTPQPAQRQKLPTPTPNDPNIPNQQ